MIKLPEYIMNMNLHNTIATGTNSECDSSHKYLLKKFHGKLIAILQHQFIEFLKPLFSDALSFNLHFMRHVYCINVSLHNKMHELSKL